MSMGPNTKIASPSKASRAILGLAASCLLSLPLPLKAQFSPEQEMATFKVESPLRVELVAAEPLIESPCAIAFDERSRLFVAENRGYPHTNEPPQGRIAMLESTHDDGRFDKRTTFADGLTFPNGVMPWKGGLIVTCAPDILLLQDTKGDGHADVRKVLLTGFDSSKSTQLRVNCPTLGPDGWIYFAAGLTGGTITSPEHPEKPAVKMTGDLRWNPQTGDFENVDGRSQYGMSFDDFGRRFICMNRLPVQHVVMQTRWLRRNPFLAFSDTVQDCNDRTVKTGLRGGGDGVRVWPISANITTADSHAGSFTAACGIMIWRGGALPEMVNGCALSCEPTGNLIHADRLAPREATFAAEPLLDKREVFASSDDWCRPVFLTSGPDGALYVCDMYRKIIEHPDYLPAEIRKHSDFGAGKSMGRIWRIASEGKTWKDKWLAQETPLGLLRPLNPFFSGAAGPNHSQDACATSRGEAAETVAHESGWWRQTATRLLVENLSAENMPALRTALADERPPAGHAALLHLLAIHRALEHGDIRTASASANPGVRETAIALADDNALWTDEEVSHSGFAADKDPRVRFQFALALSRTSNASSANSLGAIALNNRGGKWTTAAVLSSSSGRVRDVIRAMGMDSRPQIGMEDFYREAGKVIGASNEARSAEELIEGLPSIRGSNAFALLAGFAEAKSLTLSESEPALGKVLREAAMTLNDGAKADAVKVPSATTRAALALIARAGWQTAQEPLSQVALRSKDAEIKEAALRTIAGFNETEAASLLLSKERWASFTPAEREITLAALLARPPHVPRVLDAIESGALPKNALSTAQRTALSKNKDSAIKERAASLLGAPAEGDRMKAYESAKAVLALTPNAANGRAVFKNICSTCHRLDREGHQVGPDLLDIRSQPKESILLHIVVPDYEIAPGFAASIVEMKDGRSLAGIIISETPDSFTLRQPLGVEENILRSNVASLAASDHSLMPPGLESAMSRQDLADLIAFLKGEN